MIALILLGTVIVVAIRWWRVRSMRAHTAHTANVVQTAAQEVPWAARHGRCDSRWLKQHRGF